MYRFRLAALRVATAPERIALLAQVLALGACRPGPLSIEWTPRPPGAGEIFATRDSRRLTVYAIEDNVTAFDFAADANVILESAIYPEGLGSLGLSPGEVLPAEGEFAHALPAPAAIFRATISEGEFSGWEESAQRSPELEDFKRDTRRLCTPLVSTRRRFELAFGPAFVAQADPGTSWVVGGGCGSPIEENRPLLLATSAGLQPVSTSTGLDLVCDAVRDTSGKLWFGDANGRVLEASLDSNPLSLEIERVIPASPGFRPGEIDSMAVKGAIFLAVRPNSDKTMAQIWRFEQTSWTLSGTLADAQSSVSVASVGPDHVIAVAKTAELLEVEGGVARFGASSEVGRWLLTRELPMLGAVLVEDQELGRRWCVRPHPADGRDPLLCASAKILELNETSRGLIWLEDRRIGIKENALCPQLSVELDGLVIENEIDILPTVDGFLVLTELGPHSSQLTFVQID